MASFSLKALTCFRNSTISFSAANKRFSTNFMFSITCELYGGSVMSVERVCFDSVCCRPIFVVPRVFRSYRVKGQV